MNIKGDGIGDDEEEDGSLSVATTTPEEDDFDTEDHHGDQLPLWYYQRQAPPSQQPVTNTTTSTSMNGNNSNNIPYCTTSIMGKVILNSSTSIWTTPQPTDTSLSSTAATATTSSSSSSSSSSGSTATTGNNSNVNKSSPTIANPAKESLTPPSSSSSLIGTTPIDGDDGRGAVVPNDNDDTSADVPLSPQTWHNETIYVVVCGYSNGQIGITEASTNTSMIAVDASTTTFTDPISTESTGSNNHTATNTSQDGSNNNSGTGSSSGGRWYVTDSGERQQQRITAPIRAVSMDATGTIITAIDQNGNCAIWTVKYAIQYHPVSLSPRQQTTSAASSTTTTPVAQPSSTTTAVPVAPSNSSGLLSKLFWRNPASTNTTTSATTTNDSSTGNSAATTTATSTTPNAVDMSNNIINRQRLVPTVTMVDVKVTRLQPYSEATYGTPSCICLDPQFITTNRLILGFTSGKLVITSRNWMRRYEEHTVLPYFHSNSTKDECNNNTNTSMGIETIVWRSSIIAFADCSGVNLYDIQTYKPIARVDRPIGAQPSLYHFNNPFINDKSSHLDGGGTSSTNESSSVGRIKPHLYFETSRSLLVAWGDCVMTLSISDTVSKAAQTNSVEQQQRSSTARQNSTMVASSTTTTSSNPIPSLSSSYNSNNIPKPPVALRKRTVACTMAWALDGIVAADIVPIDERHVAILGYVLLDDDDDEDVVTSSENNNLISRNGGRISSNQRIITNPYEMELQILDRTNGSILYSDLLPLQHPHSVTTSTNFNQNCRLLSSFALPRMDDILECKEERGDLTISDMMSPTTPKFIDSHLRWNLNMVSFPNSIPKDEPNDGTNEISKFERDDTDSSVDSDDYSFIVNATTKTTTSPDSLMNGNDTTAASPPILLIVSDIDMVLARVRDIDDAINFALEHHRPALALHFAMRSRTYRLRRNTMNELVYIYLRALLRLPKVTTPSPIGKRTSRSNNVLPITRKLSLRRMTLAAQCLPVLLGGNVEMWKTWILVLERIPGALFVVRKYIPVRDPKLPKTLYARILTKMLEEVETMRKSLKPDVADRLVVEAEGHFLSTLLAWGTTRCLKEHVKLLEYQTNIDNSYSMMVRRTIESLRFRYEQSAAGYLDPAATTNGFAQSTMSDMQLVSTSSSADIHDSLYSVDEVFAELAQRISIIPSDASDGGKLMSMKTPTSESNSRVAIDAIAKIHVMKNSYDEALKCFLVLGTVHSSKSLEGLEEDALEFVNDNGKQIAQSTAYSFVLHLIEIHHLHQNLLEADFLPEGTNCSPICALIRLVGLDLAGEFLMQHCTTPQQSVSIKAGEERRGTLPLDLVAGQLSGNPKLFHWYLHLVSIQKPELYVKFPTTANPPPVITTLQKKHLDLYIRYAGPNRDSTQVLGDVEAYLVAEKTTPLLSFLKLVVQLGTIGPIEVGKLLEIERRGGAGVSSTFALELAYIMENYGNKNETDALVILELLLKGTQSLVLAVSFAQRTKSHTTKLWEKLIEHCLLKSSIEKSSDGSFSGILFGSLLEAAAFSGADLSHLVSQIPKGMQVEGLRPRLIAAVADYRLKVQLHCESNEIAVVEKGSLFLESTRRYRRGMRYENSTAAPYNPRDEVTIIDNIAVVGDEITPETPTVLSARLRPRNRLNRYSHPLLLPIR